MTRQPLCLAVSSSTSLPLLGMSLEHKVPLPDIHPQGYRRQRAPHSCRREYILGDLWSALPPLRPIPLRKRSLGTFQCHSRTPNSAIIPPTLHTCRKSVEEALEIHHHLWFRIGRTSLSTLFTSAFHLNRESSVLLGDPDHRGMLTELRPLLRRQLSRCARIGREAGKPGHLLDDIVGGPP